MNVDERWYCATTFFLTLAFAPEPARVAREERFPYRLLPRQHRHPAASTKFQSVRQLLQYGKMPLWYDAL
jgi:hypothetical protein